LYGKAGDAAELNIELGYQTRQRHKRCAERKEPDDYRVVRVQQTYQRGVTVMKKRNIVIHCLRFLVLLILIATLAACASTSTRESTGEYVDDSVITTKVKSLLAADDFLKSFEISVESFKGTVQLSGFVNSQKAVDKAVEIVNSVKGVTSIKNDLIVK
jgi:steroid 5-alpha reductase family enzyme